MKTANQTPEPMSQIPFKNDGITNSITKAHIWLDNHRKNIEENKTLLHNMVLYCGYTLLIFRVELKSRFEASPIIITDTDCQEPITI